jgi:uncharacterized protein (TIGR02266 family)
MNTRSDNLEIEIDHASEHNFWAGFTADMKEGGVFVATHQSIALGKRVIVQMNLPFYDEPIVATGRVSWTRPYRPDSEVPPGFGVCFDKIDDEELAKVQRFTETIRAPIFFSPMSVPPPASSFTTGE